MSSRKREGRPKTTFGLVKAILKRGRLFGGVAAYALAVGILAAPVCVLVQNWTEPGAPRIPSRSLVADRFRIAPLASDFRTAWLPRGQAKAQCCIFALVTLDRLNHSSETIHVEIELAASARATAWLNRSGAKTLTLVVFPGDGLTPAQSVDRHQPALRSLLPTAFSPVPVATLANTRISVTLPVFGEPQAFPGDWYAHIATIELDLPGGSSMPLVVEARAVQRLANSAVRIAGGNSCRNQLSGIACLWLIVTTDSSTRVFAYVLAFVPIGLVILSISAFYRTFRRRRHRMKPEEAGGVVLSVLSVIPVRLVVVPSDLVGLTRIDFILGVGLAMALAAATIFTWHSTAPLAVKQAAARADETTSPADDEPAPANGDVHVVPSEGRWRVEVVGNRQAWSRHATQAAAWREAKEIAKRNQSAAVLHDRSGRARERNTYGR
jgi:Uncharacterized protein conserved in bacteria (DUF2188)